VFRVSGQGIGTVPSIYVTKPLRHLKLLDLQEGKVSLYFYINCENRILLDGISKQFEEDVRALKYRFEH